MQMTDNNRPAFSDAGIIWLKLAVLYLIVGISIGIMMGASHDFTLRPVHAHINLLGWTTMALAGLTYSVFPEVGLSRLAKAHFWMANVSMPVMALSLGLMLTGTKEAIPALIASEFVAAGGVLAFAANLFMNLKRSG
jgi:hypothetical protein